MNEQNHVRAFVAVEIDDAIRAGLADIQDVLKKANGHVSWIPPQNIHCTLAFLGDVFQPAVDSASDALSGTVRGIKPFEVKISGLGFFGSARSPRIIWAGITESTPLMELQNKISAALLQAGLKPDLKPFNPHLTIGRVRSNRNAPGLVRALEKNKDKIFGVLSVRRAVLMESRLAANGPSYFPLRSVALEGQGQKQPKS